MEQNGPNNYMNQQDALNFFTRDLTNERKNFLAYLENGEKSVLFLYRNTVYIYRIRNFIDAFVSFFED